MESIDMKLVAHVVGEVLVVGGISFYFYQKNASLEKRISELEKQNEYLFGVLRQMTQGGHLQGNPQGGHPQEHPQGGHPQGGDRAPRKPMPQPPPRHQQQDLEDLNDINDEDLDQILDEEIEEECEGGMCPIK